MSSYYEVVALDHGGYAVDFVSKYGHKQKCVRKTRAGAEKRAAILNDELKSSRDYVKRLADEAERGVSSVFG